MYFCFVKKFLQQFVNRYWVNPKIERVIFQSSSQKGVKRVQGRSLNMHDAHASAILFISMELEYSNPPLSKTISDLSCQFRELCRLQTLEPSIEKRTAIQQQKLSVSQQIQAAEQEYSRLRHAYFLENGIGFRNPRVRLMFNTWREWHGSYP